MLTDKDFKKLDILLDAKLDSTLESKFKVFADQLSGFFDMKLDQKLIPIQENIDAIKETVQATAVAIDKQISVNEDFRMEMAATHGILTRHDGWIKQLAKKTGTELED